MGLSSLPLASGQRHKEVFEDLGWVVRSEGNHIVLTHPNHPEVYLSIPNHDEVKKETLKSIIRAAQITDQQYAVFFHGKRRKNTEAVEQDEDCFKETSETDGRIRIHCTICFKEICCSTSLDEIALAKQDHPAACSGAPW